MGEIRSAVDATCYCPKCGNNCGLSDSWWDLLKCHCGYTSIHLAYVRVVAGRIEYRMSAFAVTPGGISRTLSREPEVARWTRADVVACTVIESLGGSSTAGAGAKHARYI